MSLPTDSWLKQNASEYTINGVTYRNLEAQVLKNKLDIEGMSSYTAGDGIVIADNEISVDTDTIATVDYVDQSITGFVTEDEVDDKLEDYQPLMSAGGGIYISNNTIHNTGVTSVNGNIGTVTGIATSTDLAQGLATRMAVGSVSGTNDGTNWTSITIEGTTKNIPSGGGGGGSVYRHRVHITNSLNLSLWVDHYSSNNTALNTLAYFSYVMGRNTPIPCYAGEDLQNEGQPILYIKVLETGYQQYSVQGYRVIYDTDIEATGWDYITISNPTLTDTITTL